MPKGFEKGNTLGKGRPKGAKNKASIIAKEALEGIVANPSIIEKLQEELLNLEGKDFVTCYAKLAEFVVPKKAEIEHDVKDEMKDFMAWLSKE